MKVYVLMVATDPGGEWFCGVAGSKDEARAWIDNYTGYHEYRCVYEADVGDIGGASEWETLFSANCDKGVSF
jgi:hypothetical protein